MRQIIDILRCVKCKMPLKLLSVEYSMDDAILIEAYQVECACCERQIIISTYINNGDMYVHTFKRLLDLK